MSDDRADAGAAPACRAGCRGPPEAASAGEGIQRARRIAARKTRAAGPSPLARGDRPACVVMRLSGDTLTRARPKNDTAANPGSSTSGIARDATRREAGVARSGATRGCVAGRARCGRARLDSTARAGRPVARPGRGPGCDNGSAAARVRLSGNALRRPIADSKTPPLRRTVRAHARDHRSGPRLSGRRPDARRRAAARRRGRVRPARSEPYRQVDPDTGFHGAAGADPGNHPVRRPRRAGRAAAGAARRRGAPGRRPCCRPRRPAGAPAGQPESADGGRTPGAPPVLPRQLPDACPASTSSVWPSSGAEAGRPMPARPQPRPWSARRSDRVTRRSRIAVAQWYGRSRACDALRARLAQARHGPDAGRGPFESTAIRSTVNSPAASVAGMRQPHRLAGPVLHPTSTRPRRAPCRGDRRRPGASARAGPSCHGRSDVSRRPAAMAAPTSALLRCRSTCGSRR